MKQKSRMPQNAESLQTSIFAYVQINDKVRSSYRCNQFQVKLSCRKKSRHKAKSQSKIADPKEEKVTKQLIFLHCKDFLIKESCSLFSNIIYIVGDD